MKELLLNLHQRFRSRRIWFRIRFKSMRVRNPDLDVWLYMKHSDSINYLTSRNVCKDVNN
jgi:hypothetical protein